MDSVGRYRNLEIVIDYIKSNIDCDILVSEYDIKSKIDCYKLGVNHFFTKSFTNVFNKSICVNKACNYLKDEPFLCICDADILFNVKSINESIESIKGEFDFSLPYNKEVYSISADTFINSKKVFNLLPKNKLYSSSSIGGIILFKNSSFIKSGGYNEKFKGWGGEDYEFWIRINKLEFKIHRSDGCLYHINHFRFHPSRNMKQVEFNSTELDKIKEMTNSEIKNYYRI